jgi:hypothetical protein
MPLHLVDAQEEQTKRALRLQIGRLRRQMGARVRGAGRRTRQIGSWRSYIEGYPASAILAALGVGLSLSAGLRAGHLTRWVGLRLIRGGLSTAGHAFWRELQQIWAASTPNKN